jgi:hypothetical protein
MERYTTSGGSGSNGTPDQVSIPGEIPYFKKKFTAVFLREFNVSLSENFLSIWSQGFFLKDSFSFLMLGKFTG